MLKTSSEVMSLTSFAAPHTQLPRLLQICMMWLPTFPPSGYPRALRRKARWSYAEIQMFVSDFANARGLYFIPVAWKLGWDNQLTGQMNK